MKSLLKGFLIVAAMFSFVIAASAEEVSPGYTQTSGDVSFNYGANSFSISIEDEVKQSFDKELMIMLLKGDYTNNASLATVATEDICYIDQESGLTYSSLFTNLGVKYDADGEFEPGVYTLVKGGYGVTESRTKIFLGNATNAAGEISKNIHSDFADLDVAFGTINQTLKVYEDGNEESYIYVGEGIFPVNEKTNLANLGFAVQKKSGDTLVKGYRLLNSFTNMSSALSNITSIDANLAVGIQIDDVSKDIEIVAIPFVLAPTMAE